MDAKRWLLLVLATLGLLKGVWGVFAPGALKSFGASWLRVARKVNTLIGLAALTGAALIWGFVLMHEDAVTLALLAFGLLFAWGGTIYLHREQLDKIARRMFLDREEGFIRALSLIVTVVCAVLVWIALR